MATIPPTILTKDTWTLILSNVTKTGQVIIVDQEIEPTAYEIAKVEPVGSGAPDQSYDGGVVFKKSFSPNNETSMDVYIIARNHDGKVVVFT